MSWLYPDETEEEKRRREQQEQYRMDDGLDMSNPSTTGGGASPYTAPATVASPESQQPLPQPQQEQPRTSWLDTPTNQPETNTWKSFEQSLRDQGLWGDQYGMPVGQPGGLVVGGNYQTGSPGTVKTTTTPTASTATTLAPANPKTNAVLNQVGQYAKKYGLDDEGAKVLQAVAGFENSLTGEVGDNGQSFGIYQFHMRGELPGFAKWAGVSVEDAKKLASDPDIATRYAAETYLGQALADGRKAGLSGSQLATYVQRYGQRSDNPEKTGAIFSAQYEQQHQGLSGGNIDNLTGEVNLIGMTPSQKDYALNVDSKSGWSMCGPIAAAGVAKSLGIDVGIEDIKNTAASVGWTVENGMAGGDSYVQLLNKLGIKATKSSLDWNAVAQQVQQGKLVTLNAGTGGGVTGHYFNVEGYDPQTGRFYLGNTLKSLRVGGSSSGWVTPDELHALQSQTTINMNPTDMIIADSTPGMRLTETTQTAPNTPSTVPSAPSTTMVIENKESGTKLTIDRSKWGSYGYKPENYNILEEPKTSPQTQPTQQTTSYTTTSGTPAQATGPFIQNNLGRPITLLDIANATYKPAQAPTRVPIVQAAPVARQTQAPVIPRATTTAPVATQESVMPPELKNVDLPTLRKEEAAAKEYQTQANAYLDTITDIRNKNMEIERQYQENSAERLIHGETTGPTIPASNAGGDTPSGETSAYEQGLSTEAGPDRPAYYAYPEPPKAPVTPNLDIVTNYSNTQQTQKWAATGSDPASQPPPFQTLAEVQANVQRAADQSQAAEQEIATNYGTKVGEARGKFLEQVKANADRQAAIARGASYVPQGEYQRLVEANSANGTGSVSLQAPNQEAANATEIPNAPYNPNPTQIFSHPDEIASLPEPDADTQADIYTTVRSQHPDYDANQLQQAINNETRSRGYVTAQDKNDLTTQLQSNITTNTAKEQGTRAGIAQTHPGATVGAWVRAGDRVLTTNEDIDTFQEPTQEAIKTATDAVNANVDPQTRYAISRTPGVSREVRAELQNQGYMFSADRDRLKTELASNTAATVSNRIDAAAAARPSTSYEDQSTLRRVASDLYYGAVGIEQSTTGGIQAIGSILQSPAIADWAAQESVKLAEQANKDGTFFGASVHPIDPNKMNLGDQTLQAAPSVILSFGIGLVTGGTGAVVARATGGARAAQVGALLGTVGSLSSTFLQEGGSAFQDAKKAGATDAQATASFIATGSINSYLETGHLFSQIPSAKPLLRALGVNYAEKATPEIAHLLENTSAGRRLIAQGQHITKEALDNFMEEGGQEGLQQISSILNQSWYQDQDANAIWQDIVEQVPQAVLVGGGLGVGASGVAGTVRQIPGAAGAVARGAIRPFASGSDVSQGPSESSPTQTPQVSWLDQGQQQNPLANIALPQQQGNGLRQSPEALVNNTRDRTGEYAYDAERVNENAPDFLNTVVGTLHVPTEVVNGTASTGMRIGTAINALTQAADMTGGSLNADQRSAVLGYLGLDDANEREIAARASYHITQAPGTSAQVQQVLEQLYATPDAHPTPDAFEQAYNEHVSPQEAPATPVQQSQVIPNEQNPTPVQTSPLSQPAIDTRGEWKGQVLDSETPLSQYPELGSQLSGATTNRAQTRWQNSLQQLATRAGRTEPTIGDAYQALQLRHVDTPERVQEIMQNAGVTGIRSGENTERFIADPTPEEQGRLKPHAVITGPRTGLTIQTDAEGNVVEPPVPASRYVKPGKVEQKPVPKKQVRAESQEAPGYGETEAIQDFPGATIHDTVPQGARVLQGDATAPTGRSKDLVVNKVRTAIAQADTSTRAQENPGDPAESRTAVADFNEALQAVKQSKASKTLTNADVVHTVATFYGNDPEKLSQILGEAGIDGVSHNGQAHLFGHSPKPEVSPITETPKRKPRAPKQQTNIELQQGVLKGQRRVWTQLAGPRFSPDAIAAQENPQTYNIGQGLPQIQVFSTPEGNSGLSSEFNTTVPMIVNESDIREGPDGSMTIVTDNGNYTPVAMGEQASPTPITRAARNIANTAPSRSDDVVDGARKVDPLSRIEIEGTGLGSTFQEGEGTPELKERVAHREYMKKLMPILEKMHDRLMNNFSEMFPGRMENSKFTGASWMAGILGVSRHEWNGQNASVQFDPNSVYYETRRWASQFGYNPTGEISRRHYAGVTVSTMVHEIAHLLRDTNVDATGHGGNHTLAIELYFKSHPEAIQDFLAQIHQATRPQDLQDMSQDFDDLMNSVGKPIEETTTPEPQPTPETVPVQTNQDFAKARELIDPNRRLTTSILQRELGLGYPEVSRIFDQLVAAGDIDAQGNMATDTVVEPAPTPTQEPVVAPIATPETNPVQTKGLKLFNGDSHSTYSRENERLRKKLGAALTEVIAQQNIEANGTDPSKARTKGMGIATKFMNNALNTARSAKGVLDILKQYADPETFNAVVKRSGYDGYTYTEDGEEKTQLFPHAQNNMSAPTSLPERQNNGSQQPTTGDSGLSARTPARINEGRGSNGIGAPRGNVAGQQRPEGDGIVQPRTGEISRNANVGGDTGQSRSSGKYIPGTDVIPESERTEAPRAPRTGTFTRQNGTTGTRVIEHWAPSKGEFVPIDSQAEADTINWLEKEMIESDDPRGKTVEWKRGENWDGESLSFLYPYETGIPRTFQPDYIRTFEDGTHEIVETKATDATDIEEDYVTPGNLAAYKAGEKSATKARTHGWKVTNKAIGIIPALPNVVPGERTVFRIIGSTDSRLTGKPASPRDATKLELYDRISDISSLPYDEQYDDIDNPQERDRIVRRDVRQEILRARNELMHPDTGVTREGTSIAFVANPGEVSHTDLDAHIPGASKILDRHDTRYGLQTIGTHVGTDPITGERTTLVQSQGDIVAARRQAAELLRKAKAENDSRSFVFQEDSRGPDTIHTFDVPEFDDGIIGMIDSTVMDNHPSVTVIPNGENSTLIMTSAMPNGTTLDLPTFLSTTEKFRQELEGLGYKPQNLQHARGNIIRFGENSPEGTIPDAINRYDIQLGEKPVTGTNTPNRTIEQLPVGRSGAQLDTRTGQPLAGQDVGSNPSAQEGVIPDLTGMFDTPTMYASAPTTRPVSAQDQDVNGVSMFAQSPQQRQANAQQNLTAAQLAQQQAQWRVNNPGQPLPANLQNTTAPRATRTRQQQLQAANNRVANAQAALTNALAIPTQELDLTKFSQDARKGIRATAAAIYQSGNRIPRAQLENTARRTLGPSMSLQEFRQSPAAQLSDLELQSILQNLQASRQGLEASAQGLVRQAANITPEQLRDFIAQGIRHQAMTRQLTGSNEATRAASRLYTEAKQNLGKGETAQEYTDRLLAYARTRPAKANNFINRLVGAFNDLSILNIPEYAMDGAWDKILKPKTEFGDWMVQILYQSYLGAKTIATAALGNTREIFWRGLRDVASTLVTHVGGDIAQNFKAAGLNPANWIMAAPKGLVTGGVTSGYILGSEGVGFLHGFLRGYQAFQDTVLTGAPREQLAMQDAPHERLQNNQLPFGNAGFTIGNQRISGNTLANGAGKMTEVFFGRFFSGVDAFTRAWAHSMQMGRMAGEESAKANGGTPNWADIQYRYENPTQQMLERSKAVGLETAFQGKMGFLGEKMAGIQNIPVVGRTLFPFLRTIYHGMAREIDRLPIGLMGSLFDAYRTAPGDSKLERVRNIFQSDYVQGRSNEKLQAVRPFNERVSDHVLGTIVYSHIASLLAQGIIELTGQPPDDPKDREEWVRQGKIPHGIRFNGPVFGIPMQKLFVDAKGQPEMLQYANWGPGAWGMATIAEASAVSQKPQATWDEALNTYTFGVGHLAKSLLDMSFFGNVALVTNAATDTPKGEDAVTTGAWKFLTQFALSRIPFINIAAAAQLGQVQDPYVRYPTSKKPTENIKEMIEARMPKYYPMTNKEIEIAGLRRSNVHPALDVWGFPRVNPFYEGDYGNENLPLGLNNVVAPALATLNPVRIVAPSNDPVDAELRRLKDSSGVDLRPTRASLQYTDPDTALVHDFSEDEDGGWEWQHQVGQQSYQRVLWTITNPDYQAAPDTGEGSKEKILRDAFTESKKAAFRTLNPTTETPEPQREPTYYGIKEEAAKRGMSWWELEGRATKAISKWADFQDAIKTGRKPPEISQDEMQLAMVYGQSGMRNKAVQMENQQAKTKVKKFGDEMPDFGFVTLPR